MTTSLEIDLGGLKMKNPVTVASGTFGYGQEYDRYFDISRLGAVTTKSLSLKVRAGNKPPRLVETPAGMLNAIGLQNVGIDVYLAEKAPWLREKGVPIIANIYGHSPEEFVELAERLEEADAADALEVNLACPNVHDPRQAMGACLVAQVPDDVAEYTRAIRAATTLPLYIKLTPNVADIKEPCLAAEEAGADVVCLINTLMGMAIDPATRRPRLQNIVGGLSGPAIRPVALKMVWDAAQVLKIPVIGTGGIGDADDALQFLIAGATAISVGSVVFRNPLAPMQVVEGLETYMRQHDIASVNDLIGTIALND